MEKFIRAAGIPVRISTFGDALPHHQAVVLLHGYLESLEVFEELGTALGKTHYTLTLDMPGHGLSGSQPEANTMAYMAEVVADTCQQLGIDHALVVGHSMGGYTALELARSHPQLMAGLCLLHSFPQADDERMRHNRDREIALIDAGKLEILARTTIPKMFAPDNVKRMAEYIEAMLIGIALADDQGIKACIRGMRERHNTQDILAQWHKPLLMIFGKHDHFVTEEQAHTLMGMFPQAQSLMLEHTAHCGFYEEPALCTQRLAEFATQVLGPTAATTPTP